MITKTDVLTLLSELQEKGVDCSKQIKETLSSNSTPLNVIKFLDEQITFDIHAFYEHIRESYNNKHSKLYMNIMKSDESWDNPKEIIIALASLQLQLLIFSKKVDDEAFFLKSGRMNEICKVLFSYYANGTYEPAFKLIKLIKTDLKVFEKMNPIKNAK